MVGFGPALTPARSENDYTQPKASGSASRQSQQPHVGRYVPQGLGMAASAKLRGTPSPFVG